jgi:hypothetical protein
MTPIMTTATMMQLRSQPTAPDPSRSDLARHAAPRPPALAAAPMTRLIWRALAALGLVELTFR